MSHSITSCVLGFALMSACAASTQAGLYWYFDPAEQTVGPESSIPMKARLVNTSDTPLLITSSPATFTGDFQKIYDWTPVLDLFGRTLPALGSLEFTYGVLTPGGGRVAPGTYVSDPAFLVVNGGSEMEAQSRFTVRVESVPDSVASTLGLLLVSCLGPAWLARRGTRAA